MAQGGVVVEVLVAQRDPEDPLAQQVHQPVPHLAALTTVRQPACHRRRQTKQAISLAQQQHAAIARHISASEIRLDTALATGWKQDLIRGTMCHRQTPAFDLA